MKNYFIKKTVAAGFFLLVLGFSAFSDIYEEFIFINEEYLSENESFFSKQKLEVYNEGQKISEIPSYSVFSKNAQFTSILKTNKEINFLSTDKGYWISNNNLKNPLKVSGSYKIEEIAVQDILRFNFDTDFSVTEKKEDTIFLERKNKKISYSFAILEKQNDSFVLTLQDSKKNSIKKIIYLPGFIDNVKLFKEIFIYNLALDSAEYRCYVTLSVAPVKIAHSLFIPENMQILEKYGKKEYEK